MAVTNAERWPTIRVPDWQETRDTLQLCTQVVGKVRLANEPLVNHWWNVPLDVTARGLTTSTMPHPTDPADFYHEVMSRSSRSAPPAPLPPLTEEYQRA